MMANLEDRARAQCAVDFMECGIAGDEARELIDRFWIVVAVEMAGWQASVDFDLPDDFELRQHEFSQLRQHLSGGGAWASVSALFSPKAPPS